MKNLKELRKLSIRYHALTLLSILTALLAIFALAMHNIISYIAFVFVALFVVLVVRISKIKSLFRQTMKEEMDTMSKAFLKEKIEISRGSMVKNKRGLRYNIRIYDYIDSYDQRELLKLAKTLAKASWMKVKVKVSRGDLHDLMVDVFSE